MLVRNAQLVVELVVLKRHFFDLELGRFNLAYDSIHLWLLDDRSYSETFELSDDIVYKPVFKHLNGRGYKFFIEPCSTSLIFFLKRRRGVSKKGETRKKRQDEGGKQDRKAHIHREAPIFLKNVFLDGYM